MKNIPPKWSTYLLTRLHPEETLEEVTGDLEELYVYWFQKSGKFWADLRYCLSVLTVLPPFVLRRKKEKSYYQPSILNPAMLRNYFKIAFRTIAQNKVYSGINVLGLSIGLAAAILIMLYTKDEVSYDQFQVNNPNIYRITSNRITPKGVLEGRVGNTGYQQGPKFAVGVPEIQKFVRYQGNQKDMKQGNEIKSQQVYLTDTSFFSVFTFPLLSGNPETALKDPKSVVISEEIAESQFGTTDALGKVIYFKNTVDGKPQFEPYTVTGIAVKCPQNSSIKFDVLLPMVVKEKEYTNSESWFNVFLNTFVVLTPHANPARVEAKMDKVYVADAKEGIEKVAKEYGLVNRVQYTLQPFTEMHLSKELPADNGLQDRSNPIYAYILSGIALFILIIACINFVNLTVARSLKRAKEIGVRKVVGSSRMQLTLQFLGESFLLCFFAFVFALLLVWVVLPTFNQLANKALTISLLFDVQLIVSYVLLLILTGLLAGFYPALVLSGYSPVQTLYSRFNLSGKNYLQKSLVVLQFAIASFLIIGTLTIYQQFDFLTHKDLGYDDKHVISVNKRDLSLKEFNLLSNALMKNPNIQAVVPKNGGQWGTVAKVNGETMIDFNYNIVDTGYLPFFKIPLVKGRNFSGDFPSDSMHAVLVNEAFVKKAGWKNPIGQNVNFWYENDEKFQVVGVVKDYHYNALNTAIGPQLFTMKPSHEYGKVFLKIKPGSETASLNQLETTFKKLFPFDPFAYKFIDEENRKNYESEAKWRQILLFGAILTIFISCIGLFGLATLSAERRMKEVGIRKVLGATVSSIVQLLSADFLKLVALSFVFAFPVAYYAVSEWLNDYPYRIEISAWLFVGAAILAITIALFTVSFQSIRAAMVNPVKSLKSE